MYNGGLPHCGCTLTHVHEKKSIVGIGRLSMDRRGPKALRGFIGRSLWIKKKHAWPLPRSKTQAVPTVCPRWYVVEIVQRFIKGYLHTWPGSVVTELSCRWSRPLWRSPPLSSSVGYSARLVPTPRWPLPLHGTKTTGPQLHPVGCCNRGFQTSASKRQ